MAKRAKKAFTIVELVIVIAVIAILMAVLIPTFVSLVKKANVSSDSQLVRNLNTILTAEGVTEGKNSTMHDALEDAFENGYDITKISPTSEGNDIVWDSVSDRFALVEAATGNPVFNDPETTIGKKVDLWKIYDEMPREQSYSIYASKNWTAETVSDLKVGFDAGATTGITSVTYKGEASAKEVAIRTNSYDTEMTVNAPEDAVAHYGLAKNVTVQKVAGESYHEFGEIVGSIYLYYGHVVAESGAKATAIEIKATDGQIGEATVIKADNTKEPSIPIIVPAAVQTAIESNENCAIVTPDAGSLISYESDAVAAIVGGETYTSLQAALAEVENNGTIVLLSDITGNNISLSKNFTLDLNGHTINTDNVAAGRNLFNFSSSLDITIKNGTLKRELSSATASDSGAIAVVAPATHLTLINTTLISYTLNGYLITSNGDQTYADAKMEATNCDFIMYYNNTGTCGTAIYWPAGNLVLNDCNIFAPNCLVIWGGSAKVNGGTFVATSAHTAYQVTKFGTYDNGKRFASGNGSCLALGDAIQIQQHRGTTVYNLSSVDIDNVTTVCFGGGKGGTYGIRVIDIDPTKPNLVTIGTITYQIETKTIYTGETPRSDNTYGQYYTYTPGAIDYYKYDESKSFEENLEQLTIAPLNSAYGGYIDKDSPDERPPVIGKIRTKH